MPKVVLFLLSIAPFRLLLAMCDFGKKNWLFLRGCVFSDSSADEARLRHQARQDIRRGKRPVDSSFGGGLLF